MSKSKVSVDSDVVVNGQKILRNQPIAKFMYKGQSHDRPVRRTLVLTEIKRDMVGGFEVREGRTSRLIQNAPYKTFSRDKIKNWSRFSISETF